MKWNYNIYHVNGFDYTSQHILLESLLSIIFTEAYWYIIVFTLGCIVLEILKSIILYFIVKEYTWVPLYRRHMSAVQERV